MAHSSANIQTTATITDAICELPERNDRLLIAIAGPPGAGKSTLAEAVVENLCQKGKQACLLSMDGFHLDNRILQAHGTFARKGSPETFDFAGFHHALMRLRQEATIYLPIFDRSQEIAIAGAYEVDEAARIMIVEGNYLLLDEDPWRDLGKIWDMSVFLNPPLGILEERLTQRWLGYNYTAEAIQRKLSENDLPNIHRVKASILPCTYEFPD